jgi:hypothetical protein
MTWLPAFGKFAAALATNCSTQASRQASETNGSNENVASKNDFETQLNFHSSRIEANGYLNKVSNLIWSMSSGL